MELLYGLQCSVSDAWFRVDEGKLTPLKRSASLVRSTSQG